MAPGGGGLSLSDLPDDALIRILSFLPTAQAARCSLISRRWRGLWTHTSSLLFRRSDFIFWRPNSLRSVVDRALAALLRHSRTHARSFSFSDNIGADELRLSGPKIELLIRAVLSWGITDLNVDFNQKNYRAYAAAAAAGHEDDDYAEPSRCAVDLDDESSDDEEDEYADEDDPDYQPPKKRRYALRADAFSAPPHALRALRIKSCTVADVLDGMSLKVLNSLSLIRVRGPGAAIGRIINACPVLEKLELCNCRVEPPQLRITSCPLLKNISIRCCHGLNGLHIDAPKLSALEYSGTLLPAGEFTLLPACSPCLDQVKISLCRWHNSVTGLTGEDFRNLLSQVGHAASLEMSADNVRLLALEDDINGVKNVPLLSGVRELKMRVRLYGYASISVLAAILHNAPVLESLTLTLTDTVKRFYDEVKEGNPPLQMSNAPIKCLRETLREISIVNFSGDPFQCRLAVLLIEDGLVLDDVLVKGIKATFSQHAKVIEQMVRWRSRAKLTYC